MKKKAWLLVLGFILTINNNVYAATESSCQGLLGESTMEDLTNVFKYMKILGPVLVIIYSTIDYVTALVNKDAEEYKKVNKKLITRLILTVSLFFLPIILNLLLSFINETYTTCVE
ncbi:MAG: hypothetical protein Q4C33_00035 [bacterium]|nr:hypothetical protein [bacterium]